MAGPASLKELLEQVTSELDQLAHRWRGDAVRAGEGAGAALDGLLHQLGVVTREDFEALELRVAQLEHRLRLVENDGGRPDPR